MTTAYYRAPDIPEDYGCAGCSTITSRGEVFARHPVAATCGDCGAPLCQFCGRPETAAEARVRCRPEDRKFMVCRRRSHFYEGASLYPDRSTP